MLSSIYHSVTGQNEYNEAPYTATQLENGVQKRVYSSVKWACTNKTTSVENSDSQTSGLFWRLFKYIDGLNADNSKIAMTVPVTTEVKTNGDEMEMEMCFYISPDHQANPPAPTNPEVYITQAERTIYTRTIGGYMNQEKWAREAEQLNEILGGMGLTFNTDRYWKVGYDAPYKFWNRRNEVWYEATA